MYAISLVVILILCFILNLSRKDLSKEQLNEYHGGNSMNQYLTTQDYGYTRSITETFILAKSCTDENEMSKDGTLYVFNRRLELVCEIISPDSGVFMQYWGTLDDKHYYSKTLIDLNPKIIVENITVDSVNQDSRTFYVVRDDLLMAGTKQRMVKYIGSKLSQDKKYVYAGPPSGVAQVALALIGQFFGLNIVYITKTITDMTLKAKTFGLNVITTQSVGKTYDKYIGEYKYEGLPLGLKGFDEDLAEAISEKSSISFESFYKRTYKGSMWCIIGTGTLEHAIRLAIPGIVTIKVQVGYDNELADYVAPESYLEHAKYMPPYQSVSTYDAKIWQFVIKYGHDGDFIWNVAGSHEKYLQFYPELEHTSRYIYVNELFDPDSIKTTLDFKIKTRQTKDFTIKNIDEINFSHPVKCLEYFDDSNMSDSIFTDYFVEHIRLKVPREGKQSAFAITNSYKFKELVGRMFDRPLQRHEIPKYMRKCLTKLRANYCNTFPYGPAMYIYKKFKAKHVLDMCAGWGDRMISAHKCGVESYTGVDPNSELTSCYLNIIDTLGESHESFKVHTSAFEDVDLGDKQFDLMFTSPPYFTVEKYSTDEAQSCNRYSTVTQWLEGFMYPSLSKVYNHLVIGGHMVLCITDTYNHTFCDQIFIYAEELGFKYTGSEAYKYNVSGRSVSQPYWIFQKSFCCPFEKGLKT
jgi:16S rRNA G966 N2-methylase RsmD